MHLCDARPLVVDSLQIVRVTDREIWFNAAFVSYVGYFTKPYRTKLLDELWLPFLKSLPVSVLSL